MKAQTISLSQALYACAFGVVSCVCKYVGHDHNILTVIGTTSHIPRCTHPKPRLSGRQITLVPSNFVRHEAKGRQK